MAFSVQSEYVDVGEKPVVQQTYTGDSRQKWSIATADSGAYIIRPQSKEGSETDWCLSVSTGIGANGRNVQQREYTNNSDYKDEWFIQPAIYGIQEYRQLSSEELEYINCHGYAMMRDDWPEDWTVRRNSYFFNVIENTFHVGPDDYSDEVKTAISEYTRMDFEDWLNANNYNWVLEESFTGNGEDNPLSSNQYRVVLRSGIHNLSRDDGSLSVSCDYHFWYQTRDGRWANKHGAYPPELLPDGVTPFTTGSSGWTYTYSDDYGKVYTYEDFYDGEIYSYIITID